jgi:ribonuclease HII
MPWVVGIDEAGYGPNLGPLVQAALCLRLPDDDPAGWETLKSVVRRAHEPADGRLLIDDSKKVYTRGGLSALERGVRMTGPICHGVEELVRKHVLPGYHADLAAEGWYAPAEALPLTMTPEEWFADFVAFGGQVSAAGVSVTFGPEAVAVVPAPRFNRIVDETGSKGTVLAQGLVELAADSAAQLPADGAPILFSCDKQGGRNYYAAIVQQAFPDGWVVAEVESAAESRYRVEQLDRPVTITFRPRADGDSVAVALASMLCKYLREVCMRQFNRYWATHVPGLAPTAGYPVDARRFYAAIRPAMEKLGLTADQVWRKR